MPTHPLPANADLDKLKSYAKLWRDLVRVADPAAVAIVAEHHPRMRDLTPSSPAVTTFKLADAQLTMARFYGLPSWPALRTHVRTVRELSRSPHLQTIGGPANSPAERADEFLRLACLNYGADRDTRPAAAVGMLVAHPELADHSTYTMAATGSAGPLAAALSGDPDAVNRPGGPFAWPPLLYLTYARLPDANRGDAPATMRVLLDAGADPNAGYLWDGLVPSFTALTGVFGRGEQGQPEHPEWRPLAELLLEAGADANDAQTIYNIGLGSIARDDTEMLELLLDHGLGRGDGGPWMELLAPAQSTPTEIAAEALSHAAQAGLPARVRLLLRRGVDPDVGGDHPAFEGRTPYESAVLYGNLEIARMLAEAGADAGTVDDLSRFIGRGLAGDEAGTRAMLAEDPSLLDRAVDRHPDLVREAAELERPEAVRLLVGLGFDLNLRRRTTALHEAALRGNVKIVELLIALGADRTIVDTEHDSTPAGWAAFAGHEQLAARLDPDRPWVPMPGPAG